MIHRQSPADNHQQPLRKVSFLLSDYGLQITLVRRDAIPESGTLSNLMKIVHEGNHPTDVSNQELSDPPSCSLTRSSRYDVAVTQVIGVVSSVQEGLSLMSVYIHCFCFQNTDLE